MKFIHAADIHLDSPLVGLQFYEGAPVEEVRGATRRALENLVELAAAEKVDFVLLAGDLYDGDWKDYNTGLFLSHQMSRLREEGIRVFIISGNHDAASQITKHLRMPDNVKTLSVRHPETDRIEKLGLAIHGQGYAVRAVTDDLAGGYPLASPHHFNIGLLHTSLDGREGHESYAPTTSRGATSGRRGRRAACSSRSRTAGSSASSTGSLTLCAGPLPWSIRAGPPGGMM